MTFHQPAGNMLILDVAECPSVSLNDRYRLLDIARETAKAAGATVVRAVVERFKPQGITVALILAESHLVLTTYPEHASYMLDIFTCGDVNPIAIGREVYRALGGRVLRETLIPRGHLVKDGS